MSRDYGRTNVPQARAVRDFVARNSSRRRRRLWVAAMFISLILTTAAYVAIGLAENLLDGKNEARYAVSAMLFHLLFGLSFVIAARSLRAITQQAKNQELDERQRMIRNHAYFRSYQILSVAVMAMATYLLFAHRLDVPWLPQVGGVAAAPLYIGFYWAILALPDAIVAWNEPDLEEDNV